MLLIFDLDDTLIPTSKEITPKRLEKALMKMIQHGLKIDYEKGKEILLSMNERAKRSKEVVEQFVEFVQGTKAHAEIGLKALEESLKEIEVAKSNEINDFLRLLRKNHKMAIVTAGNRVLQQEKIDHFGIDRTLFEEIIVAEQGQKEQAYHLLQERFGAFLVVGDRIVDDLSGARKLGGITIHIRQGRGNREPKNHPDVDYEIGTIKELKEILERV